MVSNRARSPTARAAMLFWVWLVIFWRNPPAFKDKGGSDRSTYTCFSERNPKIKLQGLSF
jgi:hypothetical protein